MIDFGYSAMKDALSFIDKWRKRNNKDNYIEELEARLKEMAGKYDTLLKEYETIKNSTLILNDNHRRIFMQFDDIYDGEYVKFIDKYIVKNNELRYALEELKQHGYLEVVNHFGAIGDDDDNYIVTKDKILEVAKHIMWEPKD